MIAIRLLCGLLCVPGFFLVYSAGALLYRLYFVSSGEWSDVELHLGRFTLAVDPTWIGLGMFVVGLALLWLALLGLLCKDKEGPCSE